jgi:hypothetical protein
MSYRRILIASACLALAACDDDVTSTTSVTVTASGTGHLSIAPVNIVVVSSGTRPAFTVSADAGYAVAPSVGGTCPAGAWTGSSYATGAVTANCSVQFTATLNVYNVTPSSDSGATVMPSSVQSVGHGATQAFTVTPAPGYLVSIGGTCLAGTLVGSAYTTGAVIADCTVEISSTLITSVVTASGDGHVALSPNTPQTVSYGATQAFNVTPNGGYSLSPSVGGTCAAGSFAGNTYTTGAVTANCSVSFLSVLNWTGVKQLGAAGATTEADGAATDASGNVYVSGFTEGALNGTAVTGFRDAFVAKYDAGANLVWVKLLGAVAGYTLSTSVAADDDGNVYVGGSTDGSLNGNPVPNGEEYFIAKLDSDGEIVWLKQAGAPGQGSQTREITVDGAGNVYLAGNTTGGLNGNPQSGFYDYFVAKYDSDGNLDWLEQLGVGGFQTFGDGVGVDLSGNVFLIGTARGGLAGNTQAGDYDYLIAKYDPSGNLLWLRQGGMPAGITTGHGGSVDSFGDIYFVGQTTVGLNGNTQTGNVDYYVAKYDTNGGLLWIRQAGDAATHSQAMASRVDAADNVILSGFTSGGLAGNTLTGVYDAFVAKYDTAGTLTWVRQIGAPGLPTVSWGVGVDPSGSVFVGGYTEGGLDGNPLTGTRDYFVAKYSEAGALQ